MLMFPLSAERMEASFQGIMQRRRKNGNFRRLASDEARNASTAALVIRFRLPSNKVTAPR